jgi:hypothetical protein
VGCKWTTLRVLLQQHIEDYIADLLDSREISYSVVAKIAKHSAETLKFVQQAVAYLQGELK